MLGLNKYNRFEALAPSRSRSSSRSDGYEPIASRVAGLSLARTDRTTESGSRGRSRETRSPSRSSDASLASARSVSQSWGRDEPTWSSRACSLSRSRDEATASTGSRSRSVSRDSSRYGARQPYGFEHPGAPYDIYRPPVESRTPWQTVAHKAVQRSRSHSTASLKTNVSSRTTASSGVDSYYSCAGLPSTDPARRIKAAEARRQVQQAPPTPPRPIGYARRGGGGYPKTFWNREGLPLQMRGPLTEFPVVPAGSWHNGTRPGAARGVYNERSRAEMDVMYHDPRKPGSAGREDQFSVASYRPRRKGLERMHNF